MQSALNDLDVPQYFSSTSWHAFAGGGAGGCGAGGVGVGFGFGTWTSAHPPLLGSFDSNDFTNGAIIASLVIGLMPDVELPNSVSNKHVKKHADVTFLPWPSGQSFQQFGRLACTAAMTFPSTQVWFTVRFSSATYHQQSGVNLPSAHLPGSAVEYLNESVTWHRSLLYAIVMSHSDAFMVMQSV